VIFIWIAATRIFFVVLHTPMLGYGNQFDMGRTAACIDLWPNLPGGPRDVAYFDGPIEKHRIVAVASQRCYPSAEAALDFVAIRLDAVRRAITGEPFVDMRTIGLLKALLLVITACIAQQALAANRRATLLHATVVMLVLADPVLTLYLNTLYGEFVATLGAYAALVGLAAMTMARRWTMSTLVLFVGGVTLLAFSRMQHLLLPLFFVALLAWFARPSAKLNQHWRAHRTSYAVIALVIFVSGAAISVNSTFMKATPIFHEVNRNNMLFDAVLPATAEPNAMIAALGLPPSCGALVYSDFFRKSLRGQHGACPEALSVSPARLLLAFVSEPSAMLTLVGRGILLSSAWRLPYVGEVAGAVLQRAPHGPWFVATSLEAISHAMGFTGHVVFWVIPVVVGLFSGAIWLLRVGRSVEAADPSAQAVRVAQATLFSLSAIIISAWASSLLGDGYSELSRHNHLGIVAALASWVLIVGMVFVQRSVTDALRGSWRWILGGLVVTSVLVSLLASVPIAYGRSIEPVHDAALGGNTAFSGFVIAPYRVVAVELVQQQQLLARVDVRPSATVARYHPMNGSRYAIDYSFAAPAVAPKLTAGKPISVFAVDEGGVRERVDVRHWCVAGRVCE
jgi:hypothetical protein